MFAYTNIAQYHKQLLLGTATCVQAVKYYLQQIETIKHLNAYVHVYASKALQTAANLDAQRASNAQLPLKALHGVVISIKDVLCLAQHPVTAASNMLHNFTSIYTATAVQRLLDNDAIIIGHTNCDEFAMGSSSENSYYGPVLNAQGINHVAGGSSGGSAVAVQAHTCMVSLGSDTGGSVRQPADYCGIVGLKPTYGRISRYGLIAYASSFDQIGILALNVADAAITLQCIAGPDEYDTTLLTENLAPNFVNADSYTQKPKIAYLTDAVNNPQLDVEIKAAFTKKVNTLQQQGYTVTPVSFNLLPYVVPTYYILTTAEASSNLNRYDGVKYGYRTPNDCVNLTDFYKKTRSQGFGPEVKKRIMLGTFVLSSGYYDAYFTKALQVRTLLINAINSIFAQHQIILLPTVPTTAPKLGEKNTDPIAVYLSDIYTVLANLTGVPAITLPLGTHSNGMPFGIQAMAATEQEGMLLQFAGAL